MKLLQAYHILLVTLLSLTATSIAVLSFAKPGCNDMCGEVTIPYPFGIGANCSVNKWYTIDCKSSKPYLSALNNLEVVGVDLEHQTISVNMQKLSACSQTTKSVDLGNSPFLYSKSHNKFVVEGCGNGVLLGDDGSVLAGCSTTCSNTATVMDRNNKCLGINCCETTIPRYINSYSVNLTGFERVDENRACGSAFLVDKKSYDEGRFLGKSFTPTSLLWTLVDNEQIRCCDDEKSTVTVNLSNGTLVESMTCWRYDKPFNGNPYFFNGCQDTEECVRCKALYRGAIGRCSYYRTYDVDGLANQWYFTCYTHNVTVRLLVYTASFCGIFLGPVVVAAIIYALYKLIKKKIIRRRRKNVFKRINGALLSKLQKDVDPSLVDKTILFTSRELEKATDNFNDNRILGRGGQGTVYRGELTDGRKVAVKKSEIADESKLEQLINEVVILSQVNHRNVVKLLGCCLETEVPLLVFEFIPNGTLFKRIQDKTHFPMSLKWRLQIATEVAGSLAYLHSGTLIPIYHRDMKTTNILLDDEYSAKVSDFGISSFLKGDQTHLTTNVKGTFGYFDPVYFRFNRYTEKSDVYSFGVVLVELFTGKEPIFSTLSGEPRSLATDFLLAVQEGEVTSIFDNVVTIEGNTDVTMRLANLAMQCLNEERDDRPIMKEVAAELEIIRASLVASMVQTNIGSVMSGEELHMGTYSESTSTYCSH